MCSRFLWWWFSCCPSQEIQDAEQQATEDEDTSVRCCCCFRRHPKPKEVKIMMPIEEEGPPLTDPRADPRILRGSVEE